MRIVILTIGTHGDVRPYVALGRGLLARGHEVLIAAPENFETFIASHGLGFGSIGEDFETLLKNPELSKLLEGNILWHLPKLFKMFKPRFISSFNRAWQVAQNAELILIHPKSLFGIDIAEKLGVPVISSGFQPLIPTCEFPLLSARNYGRFLNRASYYLLYGYSLIYGGLINDFRTKTLGLKKRSRFTHPLLSLTTPMLSLNAWSAHISPKPHDWPPTAHITGYWFLDEVKEKLSPEIEKFLLAGPPPLYIGFGSMPWGKKLSTAKIIEAVKLWGGRAIVAKGWGGLDNIDADNILTIEKAPHNLLLPRVSAVVHHGGAGTTAAGLRAGRPTLICPFVADQSFWGLRIEMLGAGPAPIKLKNTSPEQLALIFDELCRTQRYKTNAADLARQISQEDGVARAIELIELHE